MNPRGKLIVALSLFSTIAALLLGFFLLSRQQMEFLYRDYTFYFILVAFALWLQKFSDLAADNFLSFQNWLRKNYFAVIVALVLTGLLYLSVPGEYRILADETNLLGMSLAMYETHECCNPTEAIFYNHGMVNFLETVIDMRPAFYSFLVFIAHSIFGYAPSNAFLVNLTACFFILVLLYYFVEKFLDSKMGLAAICLLTAFPLYALYVRSAGFETMNLLWLMLLVFLICMFAQKRDAVTAEVLLLTLPLLAQTRYESALAVVVALPVIFLFLEKQNYQNLTFRTPLIALLFLPVAWLRIITFSSKAFQVTELNKAFGFDIFVDNIRRAIPFLFGHDASYGMVPMIAFLCCAGLVKLIIDITSGSFRFNSLKKVLLGSVLVLTLLHAAARFFYFWGNLTLQYTSRLGLVFLPVIVALAVYFCGALQKQFRIRFSWFAVAAILLVVYGLPVAAKNLGVREIHFFREFKSVSQFLFKKYPKADRVIVLSDLANLYVPFRYSAIYTGNARKNPEMVENLLNGHKFLHVIAVQKIRRDNGEVATQSVLPDNYQLHTLFEAELSAKEFVRISSVELQ
jgi:hypothetical protein